MVLGAVGIVVLGAVGVVVAVIAVAAIGSARAETWALHEDDQDLTR
jgi:hypothetical protein